MHRKISAHVIGDEQSVSHAQTGSENTHQHEGKCLCDTMMQYTGLSKIRCSIKSTICVNKSVSMEKTVQVFVFFCCLQFGLCQVATKLFFRLGLIDGSQTIPMSWKTLKLNGKNPNLFQLGSQ